MPMHPSRVAKEQKGGWKQLLQKVLHTFLKETNRTSVLPEESATEIIFVSCPELFSHVLSLFTVSSLNMAFFFVPASFLSKSNQSVLQATSVLATFMRAHISWEMTQCRVEVVKMFSFPDSCTVLFPELWLMDGMETPHICRLLFLADFWNMSMVFKINFQLSTRAYYNRTESPCSSTVNSFDMISYFSQSSWGLIY